MDDPKQSSSSSVSSGGSGGDDRAPQRDQTKQAELAFKLYDKDKDGYITKAEMEKLSKNLSKEQIEKVFTRFDADGDGRLSYAEFRKMMNK
jgi:calmodulin